MDATTLWIFTLLSAAGVAVGIVGTLMPVLPGTAIVWVSTIAYAFAVGWTIPAIIAVSLSTVMFLMSTYLSVKIPADVTRGRDGRSALLAGFVGGVVGFFVIPLFGAPLGWMAGVFLVKYANTNAVKEATESTWAVAKAFGKAALIQMVVAMMMGFIWILMAASYFFTEL